MSEREVIRCGHCHLNQFMTTTGNCRRCRQPFQTPEAQTQAVAVPAYVPSEGDDLRPAICLCLRLLRRAAGYSQSKLAARLRCQRTYLTKVEHGTVPTLSTIAKFAEVYGLSMAALMRMTELIGPPLA